MTLAQDLGLACASEGSLQGRRRRPFMVSGKANRKSFPSSGSAQEAGPSSFRGTSCFTERRVKRKLEAACFVLFPTGTKGSCVTNTLQESVTAQLSGFALASVFSKETSTRGRARFLASHLHLHSRTRDTDSPAVGGRRAGSRLPLGAGAPLSLQTRPPRGDGHSPPPPPDTITPLPAPLRVWP